MCCDILFILLYIRVTYPGTYMIARFMSFYKPGVTRDVSLDALGTLRGGCHRLSFSFILRRESGHQPLAVPTAWGTDAHNMETLWG